MKILLEKIIIWMSEYFPFLGKIFGLKILAYGYMDITPWCGEQLNGRKVESKISWIIQNRSYSLIPIKITVSCSQEQESSIQVYPIKKDFSSLWDKDVCCGEQKFDSKLKKKERDTNIPSRSCVKVDYFSSSQPHPALSSRVAFQVIPNDTKVILVVKDFFNKNSQIWKIWIIRILIIIFLALALFSYFYYR
ncbi:MAG: hypothetical protein K940chlam5_01663 [Candidatus Anoxychlamydiales bacterium]|nr:hypothetical protein [Candidatus Anoxychlamydiales bacterium]